MFVQIVTIFLYVCQSIIFLTSLLKLYKYRDIYCSGWYIYLNFFGGIPGMFVYFFQMLKKLYVCQLVSCLTSLLKLGHCRDMSYSGLYIYLNFFREIPGMFVHNFQIIRNILYVCHYVSWLTSFLKLDKYRNTSWSG